MPDRAALTTTLEDALKRFQRVGLKGKADNTKVEAYRIGTILADPIAQLPLSRIRKADIASFRDRLVERGWS